MKTPSLLCCLLPLFQILASLSPLPTCLSPPTSTPTVISVVLFLWLNGWSHHMINMDLHISSLGTLVPEGPWCMFFATRHQVYWGLTQCGFLLVLGFDITHKTYTTHSGAGRLTHPYKFIFESPVICSQQLPLLY